MAKQPGLGEVRWPPLRQDLPGNFWIDNNGRNTLRGIPGDPNNPAVLPDFHIINALQRTQTAHTDLQKLLPILLPEERERIETLVAQNPYLSKVINQTAPGDDAVQAQFNNIPVYFAGRFNGGGRRHNALKNTYLIPPQDDD